MLHIDLGMVKRAFKPYQATAVVYNWIGSLQLSPVYFSHCAALGDVLDPSLLAEDVEVLFMEPRNDPTPLCADDLEITFKGFGQHGNFIMSMYGISGGYTTSKRRGTGQRSNAKKAICSLVLVPRFYYQRLNDQEAIPDQKATKQALRKLYP